MDNTHQAKVKNGHVLHKIALVQSQRNSAVPRNLNIVSFMQPKVIFQSS